MTRWIYHPERHAWLTPSGWVPRRSRPELPPVDLAWPKGSQWLGTRRGMLVAKPRRPFARLARALTIMARDVAAAMSSLTAAAVSAAQRFQDSIDRVSAEISGRGSTVDMVVCDESQELSDEALEALMPTISAAPSGNPQVVFTGTPPGPNVNGARGSDGRRWGAAS